MAVAARRRASERRTAPARAVAASAVAATPSRLAARPYRRRRAPPAASWPALRRGSRRLCRFRWRRRRASCSAAAATRGTPAARRHSPRPARPGAHCTCPRGALETGEGRTDGAAAAGALATPAVSSADGHADPAPRRCRALRAWGCREAAPWRRDALAAWRPWPCGRR